MKKVVVILALFVVSVSCSDPDTTYTVKITSITTYGNSGVGDCFYNLEPVDDQAYPKNQIIRPCGLYQVGDVVQLKW